MDYKPHPIDTTGVKLSADILELTELLSRNTHEIWARQRLAEEWRYGAKRDDERREHPGLVPYEELSEVEKQYDRNTTLETLKTILSLGYRIEPPVPADNTGGARNDDASAGDVYTDDVQSLIESLKQSAPPPGLARLLAVWHAREPSRWARRPEVYQLLGERLIKLGEMLLAYDVVSEGLKWSGVLRLRQLQALALSRLGATARANNLLRALYDAGARDEETIGLLARTHKDLFTQAADPAERARELRRSHQFYAEAYRLSGGYWTGINVATLALLSGDEAGARNIAAEVRARCADELATFVTDTDERAYWPLATLGEAALILGDPTEAARRYTAAAMIGRTRPGELASTRRNARLIIKHLGGDPAFIERHLPAPKVIVFTGRAADALPELQTDTQTELQAASQIASQTTSQAVAPVNTPATVAALRHELATRLRELDAGVGYTAAPCYADTLFLEAVLELGGETHAVLPYQAAELLKLDASGTDEGGKGGGVHYESILRRLTGIVIASEQNMAEGNISAAYSALLLRGLALMRAAQLDTELISLALAPEHGSAAGNLHIETTTARALPNTDNTDGTDDADGTSDADDANKARALQPDPVITEVITAATTAATVDAPVADFHAQMRALLFADAVSFSKLTETQLPVFVRDFLGAIGALAANFQPAPLLKNTWGDGLYLVFADVEAAGQFALDLSDMLNTTDWTARGLPADLNLRIALHAGPVYACTDPVTLRPNFIGTHVSRAARLEPITPPGQVYASQAFAALAAAGSARGFTCDYVGQTPLAKKYGTFPIYHVRRLRYSIPT